MGIKEIMDVFDAYQKIMNTNFMKALAKECQNRFSALQLPELDGEKAQRIAVGVIDILARTDVVNEFKKLYREEIQQIASTEQKNFL